LRPAEIDALVADYGAGAGVGHLATKYGIHRATVGKHLDERSIARRTSGLAPADIPKAAQLYREGWSLARIAERYGTTDKTVWARLREVGVQMRDTHGRERR
jgi:hypothetical protein